MEIKILHLFTAVNRTVKVKIQSLRGVVVFGVIQHLLKLHHLHLEERTVYRKISLHF